MNGAIRSLFSKGQCKGRQLRDLCKYNMYNMYFTCQIHHILRLFRMLKSAPSSIIGRKLIQGAIEMASAGGFPLGKVISNSKEVIDSVPNATRAKSIKSLDLQREPLRNTHF